MTYFRLWISKDGYYISEEEALRMPGKRKPTIVHHVCTERLSVFAPEEDLSRPFPYFTRVFHYELFGAPDGPIADRFAESIAKGAGLLLAGGRKIQPYRYGELSPDDWRRIEHLGLLDATYDRLILERLP